MTEQQPDAGHLLPDDEWARVVADAELEAARIEAGEPAPEQPEAHGFATGLLALSGVVTAARHGAKRPGGGPTFGVLHSAETPLRAGFAASIARMFATTTSDKSCHYMTDPAESWGVLDDALIAWHVGNGNTNSLGLEQAGYARFTRAEWLTLDGYAQMKRNAAIMRAARDRYGIGLYWMTDAQLLAAHRRQIVGGWATHDQCRRVLGGTTHTDPMPNFPLDEQMKLASDPITPTPTGDDDMAFGEAERVTLNDVLREVMAARRQEIQPLISLVTQALAKGGAVDLDTLASKVSAALVPAVVGALGEAHGITPADVEAAVRRVFADGGQP